MSGRVRSPAATATRRTGIVLALNRLDTPVTVDQLVDELVDEDEPGSTWEATHERLHEADLPALDRAGLLTFDADRGLVSREADAEPVGPSPSRQSQTVRESDDGDSAATRAAVGFALASLGVLGAVAYDLGPFVRLADAQVSAALVVILASVSVVTALRQ